MDLVVVLIGVVNINHVQLYLVGAGSGATGSEWMRMASEEHSPPPSKTPLCCF